MVAMEWTPLAGRTREQGAMKSSKRFGLAFNEKESVFRVYLMSDNGALLKPMADVWKTERHLWSTGHGFFSGPVPAAYSFLHTLDETRIKTNRAAPGSGK